MPDDINKNNGVCYACSETVVGTTRLFCDACRQKNDATIIVGLFPPSTFQKDGVRVMFNAIGGAVYAPSDDDDEITTDSYGYDPHTESELIVRYIMHAQRVDETNELPTVSEPTDSNCGDEAGQADITGRSAE